MPELTKRELKLLDEIFEEIDVELFEAIERERDSDRLTFSLLQNEHEKGKYISDEIKRTRERLKQTPKNIAGFIHALGVQMPGKNESFESRFESIVKNFIIDEYIEGFEYLGKMKEAPESYIKSLDDFYSFTDKMWMIAKILEYSILLYRYELLNKLFPQTETKTQHNTVESKPVLKPEAHSIVFNILKDYFSTEQQAGLKLLIDSGKSSSRKLLFKDNGNRLTDTFKKLFEYGFIIGCQKKDLIDWIISNFTFTYKSKEIPFRQGTVEKTISRNHYPCKSPLIEIQNGQIQKAEQPRKRKSRKY